MAAANQLMRGATGDWEVVIGLEVHAQVQSKAKLFSGASTAFGADPNTHVSLVDAAMPGMLPVINRECVAQAIRTGLGLNAKINRVSRFDRKNYFYPDLPQGYQISQYQQPIVGEGSLSVDLPEGQTFTVGIERLHLEQDAGKSLHDQHATMSYVDLNRAGVALMEIVTRPDIRSAEQAKAFLTKLRAILRALGTSDADMEKGNLRADVNVSVRRPGAPLATRCEIKNVNSIRFVGQAIEHEARRQIGVVEDGGTIVQETRLFDPDRGETRPMRTKEEAHDYRYFPDPDLLPLEIDQGWIDALKAALPELPDARRARFMSAYGLGAYDAEVLTAERPRADYYEWMVRDGAEPKAAANWLINEYLGRLNRLAGASGPTGPTVSPHGDKSGPRGPSGPLGPTGPSWTGGEFSGMGPTGPAANSAIVKMVSDGAISTSTAKGILDYVIGHPETDPVQLVQERGLRQVTDTGAIAAVVDTIIAENRDKAAQAKEKPAVLGWFVGQVMKASGGKANPQAVNALLREKLGL